MKTKLLRLVRERYSIERIDSISKSSSQEWKECCNAFRFPFYYFIDKQNDWNDCGFQTYEKAYYELLERIEIDYSKYSKRKTDKSEKVWWVNKNKKL